MKEVETSKRSGRGLVYISKQKTEAFETHFTTYYFRKGVAFKINRLFNYFTVYFV